MSITSDEINAAADVLKKTLQDACQIQVSWHDASLHFNSARLSKLAQEVDTYVSFLGLGLARMRTVVERCSQGASGQAGRPGDAARAPCWRRNWAQRAQQNAQDPPPIKIPGHATSASRLCDLLQLHCNFGAAPLTVLSVRRLPLCDVHALGAVIPPHVTGSFSELQAAVSSIVDEAVEFTNVFKPTVQVLEYDLKKPLKFSPVWPGLRRVLYGVLNLLAKMPDLLLLVNDVQQKLLDVCDPALSTVASQNKELHGRLMTALVGDPDSPYKIKGVVDLVLYVLDSEDPDKAAQLGAAAPPARLKGKARKQLQAVAARSGGEGSSSSDGAPQQARVGVTPPLVITALHVGVGV